MHIRPGTHETAYHYLGFQYSTGGRLLYFSYETLTADTVFLEAWLANMRDDMNSSECVRAVVRIDRT